MNDWIFTVIGFATLFAAVLILLLSIRRDDRKDNIPRKCILYTILSDEHYQLFVAWRKTLSPKELDEYDKLLFSEDSDDGDAERKKRDYDTRYRQFVTENSDLVPLIREFIADSCDINSFF